MDNLPEFARQLNQLLRQNGRSPRWLAQQLGVDETAVQAWLDGQHIPEDPEIVAQIEQLLNVAHQHTGEDSSAVFLANLHNLLNQHFSLAEFRHLCFNLNVDYESLPGEEKSSRIRELLLALGRNGRLSELITLVQKKRPLVNWPLVPDDFTLPASLSPTRFPSTVLRKPILDNQKKQGKVLDAAIRREIKVGESTVILVLIRDPDSKGLQIFLDVEPDYTLKKEDVRSSRTFQLHFPVDELGNLLPTNVEIVITAPDFSPSSQSKIIEVDPIAQNDDELDPVAFVLTPLIPGELQIIVEVYQSPKAVHQRMGSRPILTESKDNPSPYAKYHVMSLLFNTLSIASEKGVYFEKTGDVKIEGDVVGGDQTNYHQYFGPESPLTTLFKMIDSASGWSKAPPETRQQIGRRVWWSVKYVYRTHPWFWRLVITAVFLLLFSWLFLWPYAWRPKLITQLNTQGTVMIQAGEYTQAIQILERAVRFYPNDAKSHYNLGNAYDLLSGNEAQAIAEFRTTITLDDRFWPAYNNLARLQILTEKSDAALETLRAGLRLESEMPALETAVFQKNKGWAFLGQVGRQECPFSTITTVLATQQATVERALTLLEEAQDQIQTSREAGENVSIYLAEVYLLQGCAYDALGQPEKASTAWSDSLAHAAAVLSSEQCAGSEPQLFDCLKAEDWATRLADRVGTP